ncbi:hypothetical protein M413DRAFT_29486 [Hebeloma cylindrosporum]|uniref:DUF6533 domain-containing protein n=1 Tax=Hebeloma cylindrosporum TaxID=76867 RepID=A0A0C3C6U5_HEBCY|nr:hypothetical protein M413DRAFT_29486 [Hebeloma cylindrosporum h7]
MTSSYLTHRNTRPVPNYAISVPTVGQSIIVILSTDLPTLLIEVEYARPQATFRKKTGGPWSTPRVMDISSTNRLFFCLSAREMDHDASSLAVAIAQMRIVAYVNAGSIAILLFDTLLTFEDEVRAIWLTTWNYTKVMYILTRYSAFVEAGMIIYQVSIPGDWYDKCSLAFKVSAWLFIFGLGFGEIIMTTRTWAVWNRNRFLAYALPIFYIVVWAVAFALNAIFVQGSKFDPNPRTPYVGCYATRTDPILFISWVLLLFYDTVMFILMAIPALRAYRSQGSSRLVKMVYRDGVVYYLYLFVMSLANIIVTLTFPPDLILIVTYLSRMIHALLACRVVLHINKYSQPPLDDYSF